MRTLRTVAELRTALRPVRREERTIGLVPTMGALHEGHLSLIRRAREQCDVVVVSLFVNPAQFGSGEDLSAYPRDESRDAELAAGAGADLMFAPALEEVYPPGFATKVAVAGVSDGLCGAARGASHFEGVATVVVKLLNMAMPDVAFFGQKDAQQTVVIRRLVRDLDLPVRIEVCPTVREHDGLALSSRNAYLDREERERAVALAEGLRAAEGAIAAGERDAARIALVARTAMAARAVEPEYLELVSPEDLEPMARIDSPVLIAVAARIGRARLIDNVIVNPAPAEASAESSTQPMGAAEPCSA